ncbi:MAG TPA: VIT1/CCC1 transporter family protein [Candidatus Thermoplasmatota archaeon]|nr:VIT1/CCC1 transporter family protein [Candidatus Thermoplasmatota archaeon]
MKHEKARDKSLKDLQSEHLPPPGKRHAGIPKGEAAEQSVVRNYVRDLILGFNDGLVSVYAIVAGVAGAAFASGQIAIAGLAAAVAGALSMGLGEYLSTKSQSEYYAAEAERERQHIRKYPKLERQEIREMLEAKHYPPEVIDKIVEHVVSNEDRFVEFMMREEFGVGEESDRSPFVAMGLVMLAFVIGAVFPLVPFFLGLEPMTGLAIATVLSLGGLFAAGAAKAILSGLNWAKSGAEMMILGAVAAAITYGVGTLFGVAV